MSLARLSARELALNAAATAAISRLPDLSEKDVDNLDDSCPICLLSFRSLLDGTAEEVLGESSMGLTKVEACGHIFCMNECVTLIYARALPDQSLKPCRMDSWKGVLCYFMAPVL